MGPRFCKRGNVAGGTGSGKTNMLLQWGHAFVSVETRPAAHTLRSGRRFNEATLL